MIAVINLFVSALDKENQGLEMIGEEVNRGTFNQIIPDLAHLDEQITEAWDFFDSKYNSF